MTTNLFRTAITCRWGKFIGDALLNSIDAVNFAPTLSPQANMALIMGTNNQISSSNQQVFPTVNPIDAVSWADASGRVGLCVVAAIREEGILKISADTTAVNGIGTYSVTKTVPTGKKWTLKSLVFGAATGTGIVQSNIYLTIKNSAGVSTDWINKTGTYGTIESFFPATTITLTEGWQILSAVTTSAETTPGVFVLQIIYQESDA